MWLGDFLKVHTTPAMILAALAVASAVQENGAEQESQTFISSWPYGKNTDDNFVYGTHADWSAPTGGTCNSYNCSVATKLLCKDINGANAHNKTPVVLTFDNECNATAYHPETGQGYSLIDQIFVDTRARRAIETNTRPGHKHTKLNLRYERNGNLIDLLNESAKRLRPLYNNKYTKNTGITILEQSTFDDPLFSSGYKNGVTVPCSFEETSNAQETREGFRYLPFWAEDNVSVPFCVYRVDPDVPRRDGGSARFGKTLFDTNANPPRDISYYDNTSAAHSFLEDMAIKSPTCYSNGNACLPGRCSVLDTNYLFREYSDEYVFDFDTAYGKNGDYAAAMFGRPQCGPMYGGDLVNGADNRISVVPSKNLPINASLFRKRPEPVLRYTFDAIRFMEKPTYGSVLALPTFAFERWTPGANPNPTWMFKTLGEWEDGDPSGIIDMPPCTSFGNFIPEKSVNLEDPTIENDDKTNINTALFEAQSSRNSNAVLSNRKTYGSHYALYESSVGETNPPLFVLATDILKLLDQDISARGGDTLSFDQMLVDNPGNVVGLTPSLFKTMRAHIIKFPAEFARLQLENVNASCANDGQFRASQTDCYNNGDKCDTDLVLSNYSDQWTFFNRTTVTLIDGYSIKYINVTRRTGRDIFNCDPDMMDAEFTQSYRKVNISKVGRTFFNDNKGYNGYDLISGTKAGTYNDIQKEGDQKFMWLKCKDPDNDDRIRCTVPDVGFIDVSGLCLKWSSVLDGGNGRIRNVYKIKGDGAYCENDYRACGCWGDDANQKHFICPNGNVNSRPEQCRWDNVDYFLTDVSSGPETTFSGDAATDYCNFDTDTPAQGGDLDSGCHLLSCKMGTENPKVPFSEHVQCCKSVLIVNSNCHTQIDGRGNPQGQELEVDYNSLKWYNWTHPFGPWGQLSYGVCTVQKLTTNVETYKNDMFDLPCLGETAQVNNDLSQKWYDKDFFDSAVVSNITSPYYIVYPVYNLSGLTENEKANAIKEDPWGSRNVDFFYDESIRDNDPKTWYKTQPCPVFSGCMLRPSAELVARDVDKHPDQFSVLHRSLNPTTSGTTPGNMACMPVWYQRKLKTAIKADIEDPQYGMDPGPRLTYDIHFREDAWPDYTLHEDSVYARTLRDNEEEFEDIPWSPADPTLSPYLIAPPKIGAVTYQPRTESAYTAQFEQRQEDPVSIGCDCRGIDPVFKCINHEIKDIWDVDNGVSAEFKKAYKDTGIPNNTNSVMYIKCAYSWSEALGDSPTIGLTVGSKAQMSLVERDIFKFPGLNDFDRQHLLGTSPGNPDFSSQRLTPLWLREKPKMHPDIEGKTQYNPVLTQDMVNAERAAGNRLRKMGNEKNVTVGHDVNGTVEDTDWVCLTGESVEIMCGDTVVPYVNVTKVVDSVLFPDVVKTADYVVTNLTSEYTDCTLPCYRAWTHVYDFNHACLRYPYGMVSSFELEHELRVANFPPPTLPEMYGYNYCENLNSDSGKNAMYVDCIGDSMTYKDRHAFCDPGSNYLATKTFQLEALVLRFRGIDDVCSDRLKLCIVIPGGPTFDTISSVVTSGKDLTGFTIMKTRFNFEAAETAFGVMMLYYLNPETNTYNFTELEKNDTKQATIVGVQPDNNIFLMLSSLDAASHVFKTIDDVKAACDTFETTLTNLAKTQNPGTCEKGKQVRLLGFAGGSSANRCADADFHIPNNNVITEINIPIKYANMKIEAASLKFPLIKFDVSKAGAVACNRFIVSAPGFVLKNAYFSQSKCDGRDEHTETPVIFRGDSVANAHIEYTVDFTTSGVGVAFLGYDGGKTRPVLDVNGSFINVTGDNIQFTAAIARGTGNAQVYCGMESPCNVLLQSQNFSAPQLVLSGAKLRVTDISEYTQIFGDAEEKKLFHRPQDHSRSLVLLATIFCVLGTAVFASVYMSVE